MTFHVTRRDEQRWTDDLDLPDLLKTVAQSIVPSFS